MVLASPDDWDRYVAAQWMTVDNWLADNPDDPDAESIRDWIQAGAAEPSHGRSSIPRLGCVRAAQQTLSHGRATTVS